MHSVLMSASSWMRIDQVLALIKVIVHRVAIAPESHRLPDDSMA